MDEGAGPVGRGGRTATARNAARPYVETAAMVAGSTLVGMIVAPRWGTSSVDLLYLPAVLAAAVFFGLREGLFAAVASALAFNFFFTRPIHTLRISEPEDVAKVALLFLVALVTSQLAGRMRSEALAARRHAARNATIAGLARQLLSCSTSEQAAAVTCRQFARLFSCNVVMLGSGSDPVAAWPSPASLSPSDRLAASWSIESGEPAGRATTALGAAEWAFFPIRSASAVLGAVGFARDDGGQAVEADQRELLDGLVDQVALARERLRLETEAQEFARVREEDRIRSALLSSIGLDLEPHLAAIASGVRGLRRNESDSRPLVSAIGSEVARLQHYLSNLLELGPVADRRPVHAGAVIIDLFHRQVTRGDEAVHLSPKEYAVLAELAKHPGRVLTHAHLLRTAWGPAHEHQVEYLRVAVRGLRQKLEDDASRPAIIVNEPAVGYRLMA